MERGSKGKSTAETASPFKASNQIGGSWQKFMPKQVRCYTVLHKFRLIEWPTSLHNKVDIKFNEILWCHKNHIFYQQQMFKP